MKAATVRIEDDVLGRIDDLAKELNRSRNWIINQALTRFIEYDHWFVREVKNGLKEVERGEIATDAEVKERFHRWGVDARSF
jgi:predicted transcriptional regulator